MKALLAPLAASLIFAAPVTAQESGWPPVIQFSPVSGGHFATWERPLPCRDGRFAASVVFRNPRVTSEWVATTSIGLIGPEEVELMSLVAMTPDVPTLSVMQSHDAAGQRIFLRGEHNRVPYVLPVPVVVTWRGAQAISGALGDFEFPEIRTQQPVEKFSLSVSGADVTFQDVQLQCDLPASPAEAPVP